MSDPNPFCTPTALPDPVRDIERLPSSRSLQAGLMSYRVAIGLEMLAISAFSVVLSMGPQFPMLLPGFVLPLILLAGGVFAFVAAGVLLIGTPVPRRWQALFLLTTILYAASHVPVVRSMTGNLLGTYSARWLVTLCGMAMCLRIHLDRISLGFAAVALSRILHGLITDTLGHSFDIVIPTQPPDSWRFLMAFFVIRVVVSYCEYRVVKRTAVFLATPHPAFDD